MDAPVLACFECDRDLEHCHGTAIVHLGDASDCTDDEQCTTPAPLHLFVIACDDDGCCGSDLVR